MSIKWKIADWIVAIIIVAGILTLGGLLTQFDLIDAEVVQTTKNGG